MFADWTGTAFNQVPDSKNQIHGDEMAKQFGFKGGLVPGVTVSAYMIHPAVEAFGMDYLQRGSAHCRVNSPLYDEEIFEVEVTQGTDTGCATCLKRSDGVPLATADIRIESSLSDLPQIRGDDIGDKDDEAPLATRENMERLQREGCKAFLYRWKADHEMSTYLRDRSQMANLFAQDGFADPAFVLGVSNWVLASNADMNPWVHLETRSQNYAAIPSDTQLLGEMSIADLFEKKGHEFVDADVHLFDADSHQCFTTIRLRAIYRLRGQ
ncbi:MAG: hypothetical protein HOE54_04080 [Gammaproteobacteria bacterium]|nr:hypothetical protein [Gammaproteobacteria bacterium]